MRTRRTSPRRLSPEELRPYALRALARRAHSTQELRRKLQRRALNPPDVGSLLRELSDRGWLDDRRFAHDYARSRAQNRRYGRHRITRELRRKGVKDELIAEALAAVFPAEKDEVRLLRQRIERRLSRSAGPPYSPHLLRSLYASLLRAGFPSAIIRNELFRRARIGRAGDRISEDFNLDEDEPA